METEVILVDDGSDDGTADAARNSFSSIPAFRVLDRAHGGKGAALKAGVAVSEGDYVFLADADWSMPPEQISRFLPPRLEGFGIAIASREHPESRRHDEPAARHLLGRAFNALVRHALLPGIQDSQCGFKCMEGDLARRLFPQIQCQGWAFDVELLALAVLCGEQIVEQPIDWVFNADSRLKPLRHGPQMALDVLRIRRRLAQFSKA
jgi:glycosyltransferase involved in cell wall biosynthesis